jgi:hypothetical protein
MTKKLTQIQIEKRMNRRAEKVKREVRKIEQSQIVTQKTMNLRFNPILNNNKKDE